MLDIFIILFIIAMGYLGLKLGLIHTVLGMASQIISLIISWMIHPILSAAILKTSFLKSITTVVRKNLTVPSISGSIPSNFSISNILGNAKLPHSVTNFFDKTIMKTIMNSANAATTAIDNVVNYAIILVINVISAAIIFALVNAIIKFIFTFLKIVANLPIVSRVDRVGGAIFGVCQGILLTYLFFAIFIIFPILNKNFSLINKIDNSVFGKIIYYDNLILNLFLPDYVQK